MKLHRVPYTNQLARYQTQKADRREPKRGGTTCYSCDPKYDYTPFDGGRPCKEFGGGEADKRKAWRCECGRERMPGTSAWEVCVCGSTAEPEYR